MLYDRELSNMFITWVMILKFKRVFTVRRGAFVYIAEYASDPSVPPGTLADKGSQGNTLFCQGEKRKIVAVNVSCPFRA